ETSNSGYADAMAVSPIRDAKAMQYNEFVSFETYVFDCDGVLWGISDEDSKTSVTTVNHLLSLGKRVMFVTNNSNKTRSQFLQQLEGKGISFGQRSHEDKLSMMISASYTTAAYLQTMKLKRPFIITSDTGVLEECRLLGITDYFATIDDNGKTAPHFEKLDMMAAVDAIKARSQQLCHLLAKRGPGYVQCLGSSKDPVKHIEHPVASPSPSEVELNSFLPRHAPPNRDPAHKNYIKWHEDLHSGKPGYQELPLIACSSDTGGVLGKTTHLGKELKVRAIGNGAMADIIGRSFDPPKSWKDMGKPSEALIRLLQSPTAYNVNVSKALMVGDTLQTDIVFGNLGGMKTLLVLTGVTSKEELEE
ncbi:PGP, partial [Symbiodinium sp. KB8]